jgi:hypothetical protein
LARDLCCQMSVEQLYNNDVSTVSGERSDTAGVQAPNEHLVGCVVCHRPIPLPEFGRTGGACATCAEEVAEIAWKTVYDRDRGIGEIPPNLRAAYKL